MPFRIRRNQALRAAAQGAVVAALCSVLLVPQGLALTPRGDSGDVPAPRAGAPLTQDQRIEHALNRFTFGPRPGDEAAVRRMGLDAWFDRQLHPETIDDAAFDAELAKYPALQLSTTELVQRFPSPQLIRRTAGKGQGGGQQAFARFQAAYQVQEPTDPVARAVLADAVYAYDMNQKRQAGQQAAKKAAAANAAPSTAGEEMADTPAMQPAPNAASADSNAMQDSAAAGPAKGKGGRQYLADSGARSMDPAQVQGVLDLPPDQRMSKLLSMSPAEMFSFRTSLRGPQRGELGRGMSPQELELLGAMVSPIRVVGAEALESRLLRDIDSERQLQAVMTDFWLNHFSVYARKNGNEPYFLNAYLRDTILPNALGKFENLLVATAESPAMLMYLDNFQSIGPDSPAAERGQRLENFVNPNTPAGKLVKARPKGINENYARELMELHTLGVRCEVSADHPKSALEPSCGNGYTQADVTNVAKVLTGWTIDRPYQGGAMAFDANRHEPGDKPVLGTVIHNGGAAEGMQVLHLLATSPATAHFISYKLAVRFVSDTPPDTLVNRMADTFLKSGGDMKAVLSTMFHSPEFWSPAVYRAKIKTPIEFVASAVRASGAEVNNPLPLVQAMDKLGMPIYGMQTPNGYSWAHDEWVSSNALISRMNFALVLSGDLLPGTRPDWPRLLGTGSDAAAAADPTPDMERKLESLLLGEPAAPRTRASVLAEASDPDLQKNAQQSFASTKSQDTDLGNEDDVATNGKVPAVIGKKKKQGSGVDLLQPNPEAAPLDTMAGLLLGSPDFQRR